MRILLVTPYYPPAYFFGGPVRMAEVMVADFLAAGHEVTVATTDALDENTRIAPDAPGEPAGAQVLRFRNLHHGIAARAMAWTPRGFRRWVRANVPAHDVVVLHDLYSVLSVASARAARRAGVPYVVQPFGSVAATAERGRPLVKRVFLALWGRRTLCEASALIYSTAHEHADFVAAGAGDGPLLVDMPLPLELPPRRGEPLAADPTLVYVGRLDPIKGLDHLLRGVAAARPRLAAFRVVIIGPGDRHRTRLEALSGELGLHDIVEFRGFVEPEEKVAALERAHAFCLLSDSEGLPVSALEAMACATPVILSPGCHLDEVDGVAGLVVSREPAAVADAIVSLLSDAELRARLSAGAAAFAEPFHRERVMPRMTELLARLTTREIA